MEFRYEAFVPGQGMIKGYLEARDEAEARSVLVYQGHRPVRVAPVRRLPGLETLFPSLFRPSTGEVLRTLRQVAVMLGSGANLLRTVEMAHAHARNGMLKRMLWDIHEKLDGGASFSEALGAHPEIFNRLTVSMVQVGESTGRLGPALEQVVEMLQRDREARQKAIRAMLYPMAIMSLSLVTMAVLMLVALPPLLRTFDRMGTDLPLLTRVMMVLMAGVRDHMTDMFIGLMAVAGLVLLLRRMESVRAWLDETALRVPLLGSLIVAGEVARFSRTMAILLEAGVPLAEALHLTTNGAKNLVLRGVLTSAEESLLSGQNLGQSLRSHPVMPAMFVELITIGEESNTLLRTVKDAADAYQHQLDQRLNSLLGMLEPASTLVVAGIVGFVAFSTLLPIYSGLEAFR